MDHYSAIKNNDFMKFAGKWIDLENIILSEATQSQKTTHGVYSLIREYWARAWNTHNTAHRPHEAQEEGTTKEWMLQSYLDGGTI